MCCTPDEESKNGEFFHAFLARTGMALPATFRGWWRSLAGPYWQKASAGSRGSRVRAWRSIMMACWRSSSAKITVWLLFRCNGPFRGGRHLSPLTPLVQALQIERSCGSAVRDFIEQEWCNTPPVPPQWTPETMERAFAQRGRQIFAKACSKSGPSPRNDWISEETWSALRVHGRLRSIFFRDVCRRVCASEMESEQGF